MCRPWESVLCAAGAHVNVDEGGAPEQIAGVKLHAIETPDGKLTPELVAPRLGRKGDEHAVQPRVVSVTQSSELGTRYSPDELAELAGFAHEHDLLLHVDGSRLSNAAAALDVPLRAVATDAGVDARVLRRHEERPAVRRGGRAAAPRARRRLRLPAQADAAAGVQGPLPRRAVRRAAGGRPVAAQRRARQRDGRAPGGRGRRRARGARSPSPCRPTACSRRSRPPRRAALQRDFHFYVWDETSGEVRWMCSWDTTPEEVDAFAAASGRAVRRRSSRARDDRSPPTAGPW